MNYRSIKQLTSLLVKHLDKIPPDTDAIVGVPRSGMLVADILGLHLTLPVVTVGDVCGVQPIEVGKRMHFDAQARTEFLQSPRKLLVVDDACGTGGTLKSVRQLFAGASHVIAHTYKYFVPYVTEGGERWVDIWLERLDKPRFFEWNWVSNIFLQTACIDIDGVLCRDPNSNECDEESGGERYSHFLRNVPRLRRLRQPLGTLVTNRLERWRNETATWLAAHKIQYKKLVMMPFETVRERKQYGHARFKAEQYKKHGGSAFVESSWKQAAEIRRLTKMPVFCTETMELHG